VNFITNWSKLNSFFLHKIEKEFAVNKNKLGLKKTPACFEDD
jgi:hypothetical protein